MFRSMSVVTGCPEGSLVPGLRSVFLGTRLCMYPLTLVNPICGSPKSSSFGGAVEASASTLQAEQRSEWPSSEEAAQLPTAELQHMDAVEDRCCSSSPCTHREDELDSACCSLDGVVSASGLRGKKGEAEATSSNAWRLQKGLPRSLFSEANCSSNSCRQPASVPQGSWCRAGEASQERWTSGVLSRDLARVPVRERGGEACKSPLHSNSSSSLASALNSRKVFLRPTRTMLPSTC
mmetsp:Transcript_86484/g.201240  ORF Transcript_86484/g.201240 Transcript_86484/m.201240 type:complete len:236 (-) Transcript_86484:79-786(-)